MTTSSVGLVRAARRPPRAPRRGSSTGSSSTFLDRLLEFLGRLLRFCRRLLLGDLLGRQLAAVGQDADHERRHLRLDLLEDPHRHRVAADALDRLRELDLPAVDAHLVLLPELVRDVRGGHRAEERAGRAGLHLEAQLRLLEHLLDLARLVGRRRLVARAVRLALLELAQPRRRRLLGQPPRQQEVPGVAPRDVDDVSAQTDVLDVLEEDELHRRYWRSPT